MHRAGSHVSLGPPRAEATPVTAVRGTVIGSSIQSLRERGHYPAYREALDPRYHAAIDGLVVTSWLPPHVLVAHYEACERLALPADEIVDLGRGLSDRITRPILDVAARLAGAAGVTPWAIAEAACRLWPRTYQGGAMFLHRLGPKEARMDVLGHPTSHLAYSRIAWRGIVLRGVEMLAQKAYVREVPSMCDAHGLVYRVSWA